VRAGRLWAMIVANVKMLVRNRIALLFSLAFPFIFMVVFGVLAGGTSKPDVDLVGHGPLATAVGFSRALELHVEPSEAVARKHVKDGDRDAALIVRGDRALLLYDASSTVTAAEVRGLVSGIAAQASVSATGQPPRVTVAEQSVESTSLKYIDFLVPGLIAMALSQSAVFGVAGALTAYREKGLFRRLRLTPLPLWEFMVARVVMQLGLALVQVAVLLSVGHLVFDVRVSGDVVGLVPVAAAGAICFITLGFLIGSIARNEPAADAIANFVTLPMVFLAGVFFPISGAPALFRALARVTPLTYLANGLRDVGVRGHSVASTMPDVVVLLAIACLFAAVSMRFFQWEQA
jgi:ABC-2 type transport system permease protein